MNDLAPRLSAFHRIVRELAAETARLNGVPDEMRALFVALARTTLPAHDVHGRATIVRVGWDELERRFGRR